jgi:hypothetical protein
MPYGFRVCRPVALFSEDRRAYAWDRHAVDLYGYLAEGACFAEGGAGSRS